MELRLPPIRDLNLMSPPPARDDRLQRVLSHCRALCEFADRYASAPPAPDPPEVARMVDRAVEVINILQEYRATCAPPRAPKRPWEDATDTPRPAPSPPADPPSPTESLPPAQEAQMSVFDLHRHPADPKRDMDDIRARRQSGKIKYKKRSRATPPGHCHSCEISDTPEWRRGPDGQRTLCNACGLHYAKLVRKRDRIISALPAGSQAPPPIDIAFLRKSARLAAENSALARSAAGRRRAADKSPASAKPPSTASDTSRKPWTPEPYSPVRAPVPPRYPYGPSYQPFVQPQFIAPPQGWYDQAPHPQSWDRYMPPAHR